MRRAVAIACVCVVLGPGVRAANDPVRESRCEGVNALIFVPKDVVDPVVPDPFVLELDAQGNAQLFVGMSRCEAISVGNTTRTTVFADFRVFVDHAAAIEPAPPLRTPAEPRLYQFWFVSDNEGLVSYFRAAGGVGPVAQYVPGLSWTLDALTGDFRFHAPSPTPSPFDVVARLLPVPPVGGDTDGRFYAAVSRGVMHIVDRIPSFRFAPASGTVTPQQGSDMERLFCGASGDFDEPVGHHFFDAASYSVETVRGVAVGAIGEPGCP